MGTNILHYSDYQQNFVRVCRFTKIDKTKLNIVSFWNKQIVSFWNKTKFNA